MLVSEAIGPFTGLAWLFLVGAVVMTVLAGLSIRSARKERAAKPKADHVRLSWQVIGMAAFGYIGAVIFFNAVYSDGGFTSNTLVPLICLVLLVALPSICYWRYNKATKQFNEAHRFDRAVWRFFNGAG